MDSKQQDHQPTTPLGPTGNLCLFLDALNLSSIPEHVKRRAKYLMLDGIGCALVGAHLPWSEKATKVLLETEGVGSAVVWGWDRKLSPLSAALLNGTFLQGFELDDWHSEAPLHSNAIILPALFSAAASNSAVPSAPSINGSSFLLAYLAGLEVGPRIGRALNGSHILSMGWHSGAVFGSPTAAAAVSKLFGLRADAMEDALGIACTQAGGLMSAQFESEVKRMQHGFAARNGLLAAFLARGGYVGIKRVLEREYGGYLDMFSKGSGKTPQFDAEAVTEGLGQKWKTEGVNVKPYAAMALTHSSIDCIRALQASDPTLMNDTDNITQITLSMGEASYHHGGWAAKRPLTSVGAQMSSAYVAATQILDHEVLPAQFRQDKLERDELWRLVDKISCVHDPKLDGGSATRAEVVWANGEKRTSEVAAARGVQPALSNEEIVEKFRGLVKGIVGDERREQIEKACLGLEELNDVAVLGELLMGVVGNPIA